MAMSERLRRLLDAHRVAYDSLTHAETFTSPETAASLHVPGREMAKTVIVKAGDRYFMLVLPAHERIDLDKAARLLNVNMTCLATEDEIRALFPDCEPGAMPPFGELYGVPEYVDQSLTREEEIICVAGNHHEAIKMRTGDFMKLTHPTVADFHASRA
ncbi:MAG: YbaK/EbsC family protein [Nitrospirota bacterium]